MCSIMHALHTFHLRQSNGSDVINETLDFNVGRAVDVLHDCILRILAACLRISALVHRVVHIDLVL